MGRLLLHDESHAERASFDTAVSRALLQRVGSGELGESLRLHHPGEVLAFSPLDATHSGFADAVAAARGAGFEPVRRLAGGRAAIFHSGTLAVAWCIPDDEPRLRIGARFAQVSDWLARTLRRLGVDARVGEVPGEYCPGAHSVNARGRTKLAGIGQRLVRGATHVGGVVVVSGTGRVREGLVPVYDALGFPWDPETVGSIEDEIGPVSVEAVRDALRQELPGEVVAAAFDDATLSLAASLEPDHRI